MSGIRVWLAFALLCLVWGSSYLCIRVAVRHLTPLALVSLRLLIGSATILVVVVLWKQSLRLTRRQFGWSIILASVNTALPFALISWGELTVPSGLASVLNSTVPIFSVLLAAVVLADEPLTVPRAGGVAIGFVGVLVLLGRDLGGAIQWHGLLGQLAIVLASVCYALGAVLARQSLRGVPSLAVGTYSLVISAVEITTISLILSPPRLSSMDGSTWMAVIWLGVMGSGLAYVLAFFILARWGAVRYTLVPYLLPVVGLTLGAVLLHEVFDWHILFGAALVLAGVVLASLRDRRTAAATPAVTGSGPAGP